jgi:hypothetical protein
MISVAFSQIVVAEAGWIRSGRILTLSHVA